MIDFIIYGIIDNGVMILVAMTGLELDKFLRDTYKNSAFPF